MNKEELKKLKPEQLQEQLGLLREKLRVLRFKKAANQLQQTHLIGETKVAIARILTLLNKS